MDVSLYWMFAVQNDLDLCLYRVPILCVWTYMSYDPLCSECCHIAEEEEEEKRPLTPD